MPTYSKPQTDARLDSVTLSREAAESIEAAIRAALPGDTTITETEVIALSLSVRLQCPIGPSGHEYAAAGEVLSKLLHIPGVTLGRYILIEISGPSTIRIAASLVKE